jgi:hypothetical protein
LPDTWRGNRATDEFFNELQDQIALNICEHLKSAKNITLEESKDINRKMLKVFNDHGFFSI